MAISPRRNPNLASAESTEEGGDGAPAGVAELEVALNTPGFTDFLAKYKDSADLNPEADRSKYLERLAVFKNAEKMSRELEKHFKDKYGKEFGIQLQADDYTAMKEELHDMAVADPEGFKRHTEQWKLYQELPAQIEGLDKQINALKPEEAKERMREVEKQAETMELASQTGVGDSVRAFFSSPEDNIRKLEERRTEAGRKEFIRKYYRAAQGDAARTVTGADIDAFNRYLSGEMSPEDFEAYAAGSGFGQETEQAYDDYLDEGDELIKGNEDWRKRLDARKEVKAKGLKIGYFFKTGPSVDDEQDKLDQELEALEDKRLDAAEKAKKRKKLYWTFVSAEEDVVKNSEAVQKLVEKVKAILEKKKMELTETATKAMSARDAETLEKAAEALSQRLAKFGSAAEFADLTSESEEADVQNMLEVAASNKLEAQLSAIDIGSGHFGDFMKKMNKVLGKETIGKKSKRETKEFLAARINEHLSRLNKGSQADRKKAVLLKLALAKIKHK